MGIRIQYWLLTGLAGILLVLVVANIAVYQGNTARQKEVSERNAQILQAQQVDAPLYREIAQALVELAKRGDTQIGYMLASQGIQVPQSQASGQPQSPAPAAAPAPADPAAAERPGRGRGRP
ncbi:MAG: hypothetical protein ACKN9T_17885 [Candidatus Methylumidiphilus sp.]